MWSARRVYAAGPAILQLDQLQGRTFWPQRLVEHRDRRFSGTDQADRRGCSATTGVFPSARALRISMTPTTRNQISGGEFAMMAGPQTPAL
jgi:hypothetical protein